MPDIRFAIQPYNRSNGDFPELRLLNMYVEESPTSERQVAIMSRKGLSLYETVGSGPIRGLYSRPGVFGGARFAVSNTTLYRDSTSLGSVGTGPTKVAWAGATNEVLLAYGAGTTATSYNGTNLATVTPTSGVVAGLAFISRLFVMVTSDGRFYWSAIEDGRTWDALDYANAELDADGALGGFGYRGHLYIFGQSTTEVWRPVGDPNLPFARINSYNVGLPDYHTATALDNAVYILASDGVCYRLEDVPVRISTHAIEERIAEEDVFGVFSFTSEGHSFFCLNCGDSTYAYDAGTQQWSEWKQGDTNLGVTTATLIDRVTQFGDALTGKIWVMDGWVDTDSSTAIERTFTGYFPVTGGEVRADNISLVANTGSTTISAGSGSDPVVQIRASYDAGNTWTDYRSIAMGAINKFRTRVFSRRWGTFDAPGGMFEVKYTEPTGFRVSAFKINEHGGGRSRT